MARALDINEAQILVDFPEDEEVTWHWRGLVIQLGDSRWVGFSGDLEAEIIDLSRHRVVPLVRGAPLPARIGDDVYIPERLDEAQLQLALQECAALSLLYGAPGAAGGAVPAAEVAQWRYSDTAFENFGEIVPPEITRNGLRMLSRGAVALVDTGDGQGGSSWTTAERLLPGDVPDWQEEKRSGPGRDARVLSLSRDSSRQRFKPLREALGEATFVDEKQVPEDWPFSGPSAAQELLQASRAAGEELIGFHEYYVRSSGMNPDHPVAIKHRDLLAVLFHLVSFDQLNAGQLASAELLSRMILQIHQAVKRSPKNPDFRGTGLMTMSRLDSSGGVLTGAFARFVADEQKSHAFTLKQQRLYSEEEEKRRSKGQGGDKK